MYDVGDLESAKKFASVTPDDTGKLIYLEEKSPSPKSSLIGIALYYYPKEALKYIHRYIAEGNNKDQPGRLVEWLYKKTPVYTWRLPGVWYDIGTKETLNEAEVYFSRLAEIKEIP